mmetsp:Transcript_51008/g.159395  ORF Transcript_51008/g.159395 Transcript_51008/m.159395 type:complete len:163 (-) Transcript_51008:320-808(-)
MPGHCRDGSDATENDDISHVEEESSTTSGTGDDDSDDEPSVSSPDFSPRMEMAAHKQEDGGEHWPHDEKNAEMLRTADIGVKLEPAMTEAGGQTGREEEQEEVENMVLNRAVRAAGPPMDGEEPESRSAEGGREEHVLETSWGISDMAEQSDKSSQCRCRIA